MKIYTKTGDDGSTGLFGGGRLPKSAPRIAAYGDVDELNAVIGVAAAGAPEGILKSALGEVQIHLFTVGAQLASPKSDPKIERMTASQVESLERQIDAITPTLAPLKNFILPGGTLTSAHLHLARTVCRRAERSVVALMQASGEHVDRWLLIYLNRLSDYLFVMARLANQVDGVEDIPWLPTKS